MVRQKGRFDAWPCVACGSWAPFRRTDNFAIELLSWAAAESTEPSGSGPTISAIPAYWRPLVCSPSVCVALCRGPAKQPGLVWMERAELCGDSRNVHRPRWGANCCGRGALMGHRLGKWGRKWYRSHEETKEKVWFEDVKLTARKRGKDSSESETSLKVLKRKG
ncbi:hypothetical protein VTI28DRAFT_2633 [Corynascus sepedonium]